MSLVALCFDSLCQAVKSEFPPQINAPKNTPSALLNKRNDRHDHIVRPAQKYVLPFHQAVRMKICYKQGKSDFFDKVQIRQISCRIVSTPTRFSTKSPSNVAGCSMTYIPGQMDSQPVRGTKWSPPQREKRADKRTRTSVPIYRLRQTPESRTGHSSHGAKIDIRDR